MPSQCIVPRSGAPHREGGAVQGTEAVPSGQVVFPEGLSAALLQGTSGRRVMAMSVAMGQTETQNSLLLLCTAPGALHALEWKRCTPPTCLAGRSLGVRGKCFRDKKEGSFHLPRPASSTGSGLCDGLPPRHLGRCAVLRHVSGALGLTSSGPFSLISDARTEPAAGHRNAWLLPRAHTVGHGDPPREGLWINTSAGEYVSWKPFG